MGAVSSAGENLNAADGDRDSQIRVFIVCGPQLLSGGLAALLARDDEIVVVGSETDSDAAADCIRELNASVVVLCGVHSPRDAPRRILPLRSCRTGARVLVLSSSQSEQTQVACIQAGAVGCIDEDVRADEFVRAIKRVHAGEVLFTQSVLIDLLQRSRRRHKDGPNPGEAPVLAPREIEVLQALVVGMSTEEVAERLSITVSTVRTHLKNVLLKLGAHSKLEAVIIALREGLIDLPQ